MSGGWRYVIRNLGRRRARTALGAIGVFLTMGMLMALQVGMDTVSVSYTDLAALQAGRADVTIRLREGDWLRPLAFEPDGVRDRIPGDAMRGWSERLLGIAQAESDAGTHYAVLMGSDPALERQLGLWSVSPDPTLENGRCAISKPLAKRLNAEAGTRLQVRSDSFGNSIELEVEAVVDRQLLFAQEIKDYILVNVAAAREILGEREGAHLLAGTLRDAESYYNARSLAASVQRLKDAGEGFAAAIGPEYEVRLTKAAAIAGFQDVSSPLRAVFGLLAVLMLSVTGLLIYSIVSVAVEERVREYGILRTLGAKRRSIFGLVLSEATLLCFLGVIPGALAGLLLARGGIALANLAYGAEAAIELTLAPRILWLTIGAGVALSAGSALVPALQATRWQIVDALDPFRRGQVRVKRQQGNGGGAMLLSGLAIAAVAGLVLLVVPAAFLSGDSTVAGTVVLCLLIALLVGFTLIGVGVLPWVERLVLGTFGWTLGPASELARSNLERNRRRNVTTALMFILAVSLVVFVASLAALFSRTAMVMAGHFVGADFRVDAEGSDRYGLRSAIESVEGVEAVAEVRFLRTRSQGGVAYDVVASDLVGMKHLWIQPFGVEPGLSAIVYASQILYTAGGPDAWREFSEYDPAGNGSNTNAAPVILSEAAARSLGVTRGDVIELNFHLGPRRKNARFEIAAICAAIPGFDLMRSRIANAVGSGVLMPLSSFEAMAAGVPEEALLVRYYMKGSGDSEGQRGTAQRIRDELLLRHQAQVKSAAEQRRNAEVLYWATQAVFGLVLAVAALLSVLSLAASMVSAAIERRWEIGVLKALGLRRKQLVRMFMAEALALTVAGGIVGGTIGYVLAYLFVWEATLLMEVPLVFTMPYLIFVATLGISILAGMCGAYLPARALLKRTAAEILRMGG